MHVQSIRPKSLTLKDIRTKNHLKNNKSNSLKDFKPIVVSEDEMLLHRQKIAEKSAELDKNLHPVSRMERFFDFILSIFDMPKW